MNLGFDKYFKILRGKGEVYLRVKVRPSAAKTEIRGILEEGEETIKIDIAAPAERGKANQELINFLAREFGVKSVQVRIVSGISEKIKLIKIKKIYDLRFKI